MVGGGQSGLAAGYHLRRRGSTVALLEAGPEPTGSWPRYYDSLTLFSPARYSSLPGLPFPGHPDHYPHRDEVINYLRTYADTLDIDIRTGHRVHSVDHGEHGFTVRTDTGAAFTAPRVIAATGAFDSPHIPTVPGQDRFAGKLLHASEYRSPDQFAGEHVIVVGAGNSAVQIAVELADTATVTLASRTPVKFAPQRPLGRDMHFWFTITGIDAAPVGHLLRNPPTAPVFDSGRYRAALDVGRPRARPMFTSVETDSVVWPDGTRTPVDAIVFATGYTPHLPYLSALGALAVDGRPRHRGGLSTTHPGLGYLGLEFQRSLSSNSLRGVGRDADRLAHHLIQRSPTAKTSPRQRRGSAR
ncbi:NAD(P)/FAD-dependent oxidoreductase [Nocardia uniformis]|uniref:NAD(P)/FAD-dependent oxidoreductase n=1 Tax=Nocardia uniformis TaxID=53432 RepID=A0A849C970_9NOCA|nr:NAD(P)/FAD-dependent oxidoreductase [Nocardia uniformis]